MKLVLILLLISSFGSAASKKPEVEKYFLDILPLHLQYRYEDNSDQMRTNIQYQAYSLGLQISDFRTELEYSQYSDSTGNPSVKIEKAITEFDLALGYRVYVWRLAEHDMSLSFFGNIWFGQTQTKIDTTLLTSKSTLTSGPEQILGVGASVIGRISYFIMLLDFKMLNSKNMSPQSIPVYGLKIGTGIPF